MKIYKSCLFYDSVNFKGAKASVIIKNRLFRSISA